MVSTKKIASIISEAINTSAPTLEKTNTSTSTTNQNSTKPKQYNKEILNPIIYKKGKILPQEKIQDTAVKNATDDERNRIIALSMYYQIGRYDPFNAFIVNNRNRNIVKLFKKYTEEKLLETNALIQIYIYINQIEDRMKLDKTKNKNKKSYRT